MRRLLLFTCLFFMAFCVEAQTDTIASGTCGDSLTWVLTSDSTLTISGTGKMQDYVYYWGTPLSVPLWYNKKIKNVVVKNGVTSIGNSAFRQSTSLTSITIPNSVTSIGDGAFNSCTGLTSITIPNSVTSIGSCAFEGCTGLTSITIPNSVTSIGGYAFQDCTGLTSITIPNSVTNIVGAFRGCKGLTSISIPNSVTNIVSAFSYCTGLTSISIPNSVISIADAFSCCTGLTSVTIPNSVTSIGEQAFYGCTDLTSINIPNSVTSIESSAFKGCGFQSVTLPPNIKKIGNAAFGKANVFVNEDSYTLVALWAAEYEPIQIGTEKKLYPPTLTLQNATQTKISAIIHNYNDIYTYWYSARNTYYKIEGDSFTIEGLEPKTEYTIKLYVSMDDDSITLQKNKPYTTERTISTKKVTLTAMDAKVINEGNVIVSASSNIDDDEANVGFEWRRTDWPDDFKSNSGGGYLYDGQMEGYIRNLNANYLWRYRPYYESSSGTRYYGDWVGIDPSNTSYFDPTVHTYAKVNVSGNSAKVKGYAQRGTDNITSQGFVYWKSCVASSAYYVSATEIPANAVTVEVSGTVMETTLQGLDFNSKYAYVAFVKTSEGETFYGAKQTFSIGEDPDGVISAAADAPATTVPAGIYDLSGRRLPELQKGINIVRYKDGTVKKVLIK